MSTCCVVRLANGGRFCRRAASEVAQDEQTHRFAAVAGDGRAGPKPTSNSIRSRHARADIVFVSSTRRNIACRSYNHAVSEPTEDFAAMFEASLQAKRIERGQTIEGTIVAIGPEVAFVDVGGKGEATSRNRRTEGRRRQS